MSKKKTRGKHALNAKHNKSKNTGKYSPKREGAEKPSSDEGLLDEAEALSLEEDSAGEAVDDEQPVEGLHAKDVDDQEDEGDEGDQDAEDDAEADEEDDAEVGDSDDSDETDSDDEAESEEAEEDDDTGEIGGSHAKDSQLSSKDSLQEQVEADRQAAFDALGLAEAPAAGATPPVAINSAESAFIAAAIEEAKARKRRARLKVAGITAGALVGLVAIAYAVGCILFSGHFLPGTTIGGSNVSLKSDQDTVVLINKTVDDYTLDVVGTGFSYRTTGKDLKLSADADGIVRTMHENQPFWQWPVLIFEPKHDETDLLEVEFKSSVYEDDLKAAVATFNETATPPTNATIVFNQAANKFEVQPEVIGTQLDAEAILDDMADAIGQLDEKVLIGEDDLLKPAILSTDEKIIQAAELATGMVSAKLSLVMGGAVIGEVDGSSLSSFVTMNDNFEITFREEEMNAWVNDLAYGYDTIGTERYYTRADGKEVVVPAGGEYGWEVDSEALKSVIIDGIRAGQVAEIEVPCVQTAAVYNGPNQRDWGNRYVDVDLSEQYVRFYGDDGSIIWESACISGSPDGEHNTGPGTWYVNNMESPSKLIGYEHGKKIYETMVTYWMAFEYSGIGFHDATWQPSFGGSMYANGYGSHGCINLPYDAAQSLYSIINIGDCVVVHF